MSHPQHHCQLHQLTAEPTLQRQISVDQTERCQRTTRNDRRYTEALSHRHNPHNNFRAKNGKKLPGCISIRWPVYQLIYNAAAAARAAISMGTVECCNTMEPAPDVDFPLVIPDTVVLDGAEVTGLPVAGSVARSEAAAVVAAVAASEGDVESGSVPSPDSVVAGMPTSGSVVVAAPGAVVAVCVSCT